MQSQTKIGRVWVFDQASLEQALEHYQQDSIDAYPHQEERIRIAVAAIRDFLQSEYADDLTLHKKPD